MKISEAVATSSVPHLTSIISNPQWLHALTLWYQADGGPCQQNSAPFALPLDSWQDLQSRLVATMWFEQTNGKIMPTLKGHDFLARASELYRAMRRETREDKIMVELLSGLPRGAAVDIGCGPGHSTLRLARLGYTPVYAYDLSAIGLEIARAILEHEGKVGYLYAGDATPLSQVEDSSLAVIYSRGALHYFKQADLARSFNRKLRPGGHVVAEIVGLHYYLQSKHLRSLLRRRWRQPLSYARTVLRTLIYEAFALQPRLAAGAPEIGYTKRSIHRLARKAGLEVQSILPAPSSVGYLVVMQKPV